MVESLSSQEARVVELASHGLTDKRIALELGIATSTGVTYWIRIRSKLGHLTRAEIVGEYISRQARATADALQHDLAQKTEHVNELAGGLEALQSALNFAPVAILLVRPNGEISYGNDEAARLLRCNRSELANHRIGRFIPAEFHEAHREHRKKFLESPHKTEMGHVGGVTILDFDGNPFRGTVTINLAPSGMGDAVVVIMARIPEADSV